MVDALDQDEVAARMNEFQEMISDNKWCAACIDEARDILNSYAKNRSRFVIAQLELGDLVSFNPNRTRGNYPSIVRGEIVEILRSRIRVRAEGSTQTWTLPAWAVIDRYRGVLDGEKEDYP